MLSLSEVQSIGKEIYELMTGQRDARRWPSSFQYAVKDEVTSPGGAFYLDFCRLYDAKEKIQNLVDQLSHQDPRYTDLLFLEQMLASQERMEEGLCIKAFCYGYLLAKGLLGGGKEMGE